MNIEYTTQDELHFKLFDVSGRLVTQIDLYPYFLNRVLNLDDFANGVYIFKVDDGKKMIQTGKVVKVD